MDKPAPRKSPGRMRKHSLVVAGHSTSISLESAFWEALRELARERALPVAALVAEIDAGRGEANLSSALRVHILQVFRGRAPHGSGTGRGSGEGG